MLRVILLIVLLTLLSGCTEATWELMYRDARVLYQDARYVIHEFKDIPEGK